MTKDEIFIEKGLLTHWGTLATPISEGMDIWAKQQSIEFCRWLLYNRAEICLGIIVSNLGTHDSIDELYNLFIQQNPEQ